MFGWLNFVQINFWVEEGETNRKSNACPGIVDLFFSQRICVARRQAIAATPQPVYKQKWEPKRRAHPLWLRLERNVHLFFPRVAIIRKIKCYHLRVVSHSWILWCHDNVFAERMHSGIACSYGFLYHFNLRTTSKSMNPVRWNNVWLPCISIVGCLNNVSQRWLD